jgi:hypothetical protein
LYLPSLENGSVLLDGDVIILARAPRQATLYVADVLHRFWLVSLMRRHFATEPRSANAAWMFARSIEAYNLRCFAARLIAMADTPMQINATKRQADLEARYAKAYKLCVNSTVYNAYFDFTNAYRAPFGVVSMPIVDAMLHNVCIDLNSRTRFFTRLIRDAGGLLESSESVAARFRMDNATLRSLVRDVVHNYQPQHHLAIPDQSAYIDAAEDEFRTISTVTAAAAVAKKKEEKEEQEEQEEEFMLEEELFTIPPTLLAKTAITGALTINVGAETTVPQAVAGGSAVMDIVVETTEEEKIQTVINDAASSVQPVVFNTQLYCVTCDVPGHHTSDCPRRDFMDQLRQLCRSSWDVFYAPENGICPSSNSLLARHASKHFTSRAGIINRRTRRDETVVGLPPIVQPTQLRWIADEEN